MDPHERRKRDDLADDADADFAAEHDDTTFADDTPGIPSDADEPETPSGRGGDGGMDPG